MLLLCSLLLCSSAPCSSRSALCAPALLPFFPIALLPVAVSSSPRGLSDNPPSLLGAVAHAAHDHDHPPPGHRPGLPAAQAPRARADVRAAVRQGARLLSRGVGASAARPRCCSTSTRSAWSRRHGPAGEGVALEQYVNDRPYVASSFLSVAIAQVFGTALAGRCKRPPGAGATRRCRSTARLAVAARAAAARRSCAGCSSRWATRSTADAARRSTSSFPEWGESRYFTVTLRAHVPAAASC